MKRSGAVFYGWYILIALCLIQMLSISMTALAFGALVKPVSAEFDLSRANMNMGLMAFIAGLSLISPLVGRLLDRMSISVLVTIGGIMFAIGFIIVSMAATPFVMLVTIVLLIGPATAICGPLTASVLLSRWFAMKRGRAFGISAASMSVGGFFFVPLLGVMIEAYGWRFTMGSLGIGAGVIMAFLAAFVIRSTPGQMGLLPDGADAPPPPTPAQSAAAAAAIPVAEQSLLRRKRFWLIAIAISILQALSMAISASIIPLAVDRGIQLATATLLISATSISGIAGKLLVGFLVERVASRWVWAGTCVGLIVLLVGLSAPVTFVGLFVICLVVGAAMGAVTPLGHFILAEHFERVGVGRAIGYQTFMQVPFVLGALHFVGASHDMTGNYNQAFLVFMGVVVLSGILMVGVRNARAMRVAPV